MTLVLTTKISAFIQRMTEGEEQAQWGFELLLKRDDYTEFFDHLYDAGLFSPEQNPGPRPADQPGYVHIHFWYALNYLVAVARRSGEIDDPELAQKVMIVVRDVTHARESDGSIIDNYHTWRTFADILGLVPGTVVTMDDLDLIPIWLSSKYDRGGVGSSLDKGVIYKCLTSDMQEDWNKASIALRHCTAIEWVDEEGFGGKRKKPVTIVDDYWLKKLIEHHASNLGIKVGRDTANIFLDRLREVFDHEGREVPSFLQRPAIEDHDQNHSWDGPANRFVEGLRDVLLGWVDHDFSTAQPFILNLIGDGDEIVRRVGIFLLNKRWDVLLDTYLKVLGPQLFDRGHLHELYGLLHDHFHEFSEEQKTATIEAIRQIPSPAEGDDSDHRQRYIQRNWLSAISRKGYEPADTWFQELQSDEALGTLPEHPDFHSYIESWSGPGPSPYSLSELLAFSEDGTIIDRLNDFQQTDSWRGPTSGALVDTLEEAVMQDHRQFIGVLPSFLDAGRPYQYGIINGFKRLWDAPEEKHGQVDWNSVWDALVGFIESLLGNAEFWNEQVEPDHDLTPTRDWIPPVIAELLRSGTRNDEKAFLEALLPRTWSLIELLLENLEQEPEAHEDAMHQAINSSKGKAIEALFSQALRECRIADCISGGHVEIWERMQPTFERELAKCKDDNFEFSTLIGSYIANIDYIDHSWLQANIGHIFPQQYISNFACALEGLAYAPATRSVYAMLLEGGVLDFSLQNDLKGRHSRNKIIQRIALAYLWGDEDLGSSRFTSLFKPDREDDLDQVSSFLWSVNNQELTKGQVELILCFWEKCIEWTRSVDELPVKLLSNLSRLSCYIESIEDREERLLCAVAPHVSEDYNSIEFIEQLDRLAERDPAAVSAAFQAMLKAHKPIYDYQDQIRSLLTKLDAVGLRKDAMVYADQLRHLAGMREFFDQLGSG